MTKATNTHTTTVSAPNPHQAPPVSIATRRDLFGTMGALLLLTAAEAGTAKAAEIDGDLLAAYAQWLPLDRERMAIDRLYVETRECNAALSARIEAYAGDWRDAVYAMEAMPARTPEGVQVKARVLRALLQHDTHLGGHAPNSDTTASEDFAWSLVNDVLGRVGA